MGTIVLLITGPIARSTLPRLCERVRMLLGHRDAELIVCDVSALVETDAVTVDALARLQLTARRLGRRVQLLDARGELQGLLTLTGLTDLVPPCAELPLEPRGEAEEREPARGVEEERDPADPAA